MDALMEKARLAEIEIEEEAERVRREVEEKAKHERYEEVRLAVATVLEEEATPLRRVLIKRARPKPTEADKQARAAAIEDLVPKVDMACVLAGCKPAKTPKCVSRIRDHLAKEDREQPFRWLIKALGAVQKRRATKEN